MTPETAVRSPLEAAKRAANGDTLRIAAGVYQRGSLPFLTYNKDLKILPMEGAKVAFCNGDNTRVLKYTGVGNNVYSTTRASARGVYDMSFGFETGVHALAEVSSVDTCKATPDSYFIDGDTVYVHTHDGRVPDVNIIISVGATANRLTNAQMAYVKDIHFLFGLGAFDNKTDAGSEGCTLLADGCVFAYGGQNGLQLQGCKFAYLRGCTAKYNMMDGFNYHAKNGVICRAIEMDCRAYGNGMENADNGTCNGTTIHDGSKIVRLNGAYYRNGGPNVADVNDGTISYNVCCVAADSAAAPEGRRADYCATNAEMYLFNCVGYNSPVGILTYEEAGNINATKIYMDCSRMDGDLRLSEGTTVSAIDVR